MIMVMQTGSETGGFVGAQVTRVRGAGYGLSVRVARCELKGAVGILYFPVMIRKTVFKIIRISVKRD